MELTLRTETSLDGVNSAEWDALDHAPSPFLEWGFLRALERSGSIGDDAGWMPIYLLAEELRPGGKRLVGGVPAFVKNHSYGEYIFDWGWARSSEQAGLRYYPKMVVAAPVTPATGKRILLHPDLDAATRRAVATHLAEAVRSIAEELRCSSVHWLFCTREEHELLDELGFARRSSLQFHWHNRSYVSFDDFLARLTSRKRKQFRKERRRAREAVDALDFVPGEQVDEEQLQALDRYYRRTVAEHGGIDYLRKGFFHHLIEELPQRVRFARAHRGGDTIAGALFFETEHGLYGRYWGCDEDHDCLHFETAYYAGIERCIERGLPLFEAGAQGEHKLLRGFEPSRTYSNHWIRHPGLFRGVRQFLAEEARAMDHRIAQLASHGPYRQEEL